MEGFAMFVTIIGAAALAVSVVKLTDKLEGRA